MFTFFKWGGEREWRKLIVRLRNTRGNERERSRNVGIEKLREHAGK